MDALDNSQPRSRTLVILLGSARVPAEISPTASNRGEDHTIILRGDFDQPAGNEPQYPHYRNVIQDLDISRLETDYTKWFHTLTGFLRQYSASDHSFNYQGVNLILAGNATSYLRLFEYYEEFACAKLLLEEIQPASVRILADPPESARSIFIHSLVYLAGRQGLLDSQLPGDGNHKANKWSYVPKAYQAILNEFELLRVTIDNYLHRRVKTGNICCVEENAYNIPVYLPAFEWDSQHQHMFHPCFLSNNIAVLNSLQNLPYVRLSPYDGFTIGSLINYPLRIRAYLRANDKLFQDTAFHDLFSWNGINVWPLTYKELRRIFVLKNFKVLWYLIMIDKLFARLKPKAVLTTYGLAQFRNAVMDIGKNRQIPTIILQNAAIPQQQLWSLLPDHQMLVWGQGTKDFLTSMGAKAERLHVVGPTKYSKDVSTLHEIDGEFEVKRLGLRPDRPLILYTANFTGAWGHYYDWETTELLTGIVNHQTDYQLMITLHPRCPQHIAERVAQVETERIKLVKKPDMALLYQIADVGVTQFSTTAIDASIYGLPIISVLPHNRPDWLGMGRLGAALIARDEAELAAQLDLVLNNEMVRAGILQGQKTYHAQYLNNLNSQAGSRISNCIVEIVKSQSMYRAAD